MIRPVLAFIVATLIALVCTPAAAQQPVVSCIFDPVHTRTVCENTPLNSTAAEASHLFRGGGANNSVPGLLSSIDVANWSGSANLTVMLVDANAIPGAGTLNACTASPNNNSACILKWFSVATANGTAPGIFTRSWAPGPVLHFQNGLVALCSTTGPTTFTPSANCTFSAEVE